MRFAGFNWDKGNRLKCQKHGVSIAEIASVFARPAVILPDKETPQEQTRFRAIGTTAEGRNVFIVFTWRDVEDEVLLRPVSARYMHKEEVDDYEKAYPGLQNG